MAVKTLILENFRCWEKKTIEVGRTGTHLIGANGSGKTTIREAITFVFTGTDSAGTKNPQHLIRRNQESTKVTIITDRAKITRTLTAKGNGSIRLEKGDISASLKQNELEQMLGPTDLFLSIFIPGYFLDLPGKKQTEVINSVLPKIDRYELLKELFDVEMSSEEKMAYSLERRRPDLVAQDIAKDRREAEKGISKLEGIIATLESIKPVEKPSEPVEVAKLSEMEALSQAWREYDRQKRPFEENQREIDDAERHNKRCKEQQDSLQQQIDVLKFMNVPEVIHCSQELEQLEGARPEKPEKPSVLSLPSTDMCPSCGQAVGLKHRERVQKNNEALLEKYRVDMAEYDKVTAEIDSRVASIKKRVEESHQARNEALQANESVKTRKNTLENEMKLVVPKAVPEPLPTPPTKPTEPIDAELYTKYSKIVSSYRAKVTEYEYVQRQISEASEKISKSREEMSALQGRRARLDLLERAIKALPQEEMKRQMKDLEMDDLHIHVDDAVKITFQDMPYSLLSTGHRMKADIKLSCKLNSLAKKPVNLMFLENYDLIDEVFVPPGIQWFTARVKKGQEFTAEHI